MNQTSVTIELHGGRKLHEYYNPTTWDDFFGIVKHLKYADTVHLKCYIGILQLMEFADLVKSIIDLECDTVEFIMLKDIMDPALLYERYQSHVSGEIECAKVIVKNFTNRRFQNFNNTKLLSTFDKTTWTDIEQIKTFILKLEAHCKIPVIDSDKKWQEFTTSLVNQLEEKDFNDYINSYKLVGGEIFSNV